MGRINEGNFLRTLKNGFLKRKNAGESKEKSKTTFLFIDHLGRTSSFDDSEGLFL